MVLVIGLVIVALMIKFYFIASPSKRKWAGKKWLAFAIALAALNLSEGLIYISVYNANYPDNLLKSYYVCCAVGAVFAFYYVMDGAKYRWQAMFAYLINIYTSALVCVILFTNEVVGGFGQLSVPIMAEKGQYYWLFAMQIIIVLPLALVTLWHNASHSKDRDEQIAYIYAIKAMCVLVVVGALVMLLKLLGVEANGTGLIPLATTWFIYQTSVARNSNLMEKDPRTDLPGSKEAMAAEMINNAHARFSLNDEEIRPVLQAIEIALIKQRYEAKGFVKKQTYESLGIAKSTFYKKLGLIEEPGDE